MSFQRIELTIDKEKVVLVPGPGGRLVCETAPSKPPASTRAPTPAPERAPPAPTPARASAKAEGAQTKAKNRAAKPPVVQERTPPAAAQPGKKRGRPPKQKVPAQVERLVWAPVVDAGYNGFSAETEFGVLKILRAKGTQWALFYESPGAQTKPMGCFLQLDAAKVGAQALFDGGKLEGSHRITAEMMKAACPMPREVEEAEEAAEEREPPRSTPTRDEAPEGETTAEKDARMMASFKKVLESA